MITSAAGGLTSIIVPCWNQLEFTRQCVAALKKHTRPPWELIAVDNGSTDGTANYLAGVRDLAAVPVTLVSNTNNLGFPAAINQGLRLARGEYLVLLNNDVVVTEAWLDQLIALANAESGVTTEHAERSGNRQVIPRSIGLAGPMSNYAAPPQLVENVSYRDLNDMDLFARRWRDDHLGKWLTVPKLSGFCLLMKRVVYEKIGGLDERFGIGLFDDDDLAERARRAGFDLAVAHDLFVHHFGSRTFAGNGIDFGKLLDENARRFADKWGLAGSNGRKVELQPFGDFKLQIQDSRFQNTNSRIHVPESGGTAAGPNGDPTILSSSPVKRAKVSLTMIVRNEQENLPKCLASIEGIFDEIVIVDTGSTDRTKEIAREFGARVFEFEWIDDFAAARNEALSHATSDYVFWLDADDVVEPAEREKLLALLAGLLPLSVRSADCAAHTKRGPSSGTVAAYVVRCACDPRPDGVGGETVVDHVRLFPLLPGVRWTYRVHEQIVPSLNRAKVPVRWTDLVVRHTGYADPVLEARKLERNIRILEREVEERPGDPFVLFNLGASAVEQRRWPEALDCLNRSLARSAPTDSIVRKLYALIGRVHQMTGNSHEALRVCAEGLTLDPENGELWFRQAIVHRHRGESSDAERCWRRVLTLRRPEQFCSFDQGIYGHLSRRNLAVLAAERGDQDEARRLWQEVLAECPGDREALAKLEQFRTAS